MNGDILFNVYQFLSINDIQSCMLVSSTFCTFIDCHFWKSLLLRDYCELYTDDLKKEKFYYQYIKCICKPIKKIIFERIYRLIILFMLNLHDNQLMSLPSEFGQIRCFDL